MSRPSGALPVWEHPRSPWRRALHPALWLGVRRRLLPCSWPQLCLHLPLQLRTLCSSLIIFNFYLSFLVPSTSLHLLVFPFLSPDENVKILLYIWNVAVLYCWQIQVLNFFFLFIAINTGWVLTLLPWSISCMFLSLELLVLVPHTQSFEERNAAVGNNCSSSTANSCWKNLYPLIYNGNYQFLWP